MNGIPPPFVPPVPVWQEHKTDDGRSYYYNTITRQTQWNKPDELMTPAERAAKTQGPWKEYTAEGGRKYWYNEQTKESSWEMPEAFRAAMAAATTPTNAVAPFEAPNGGHQPGFGGPSGFVGGASRDHQRDHRDMTSHPGSFQAQAFVPAANNDPEYSTPEEAEAAFFKMLRQCKVQPDWTWEQALPAIMRDPQFRAIKDPKQRKHAFLKYCDDVVAQDKERAKERLAKLRADFATMLRSHPEIKHYTRWKTARPMIEGETIFRSTDNDLERRQLFEDYIIELKRAHQEQEVTLRKSAMDGLIELLPKLSLEHYTPWSEAQAAIDNSHEFRHEEKYRTLNKYDVLTVFSNHIKALERGRNEEVQQEKKMKMRKERKTRDAFLSLLKELKQSGKIKAGTKWSQIYPAIKDDERYLAMAGQPGSTAMDLFWDVVEDEERALRSTKNLVQDIIDDKHFKFTTETTLQEFEAFIRDDHRTASIDRDILALIYERIREKKAKRPDDDKHLDRHQRRAIEDLRSFMKRLEPPIMSSDTYEQVKGRIGKTKEFLAVRANDDRQSTFLKVQRRQKEKEEEERDRQHRRERDDHRDRGERHRNGGRSGRSRSPEQNPYEADRRKAVAEREKNYRKSSMAESLLSDRKSIDGHYDTIHDKERDRDRRDVRDRDRERDRDRDRDRDHRDRDRDRDGRRDRDRERERERDRDRDGHRDRERDRERDRDRDRDYDRRPRDELNHYDRERRTRDEDRERIYRRRVMDRDVDELPYGDERPTAPVRRPRPEDDEHKDAGRNKRIKTEPNTREQTPNVDGKMTSAAAAPKTKEKQPTATAKDLPAQSVRAGSEEGEIEED